MTNYADLRSIMDDVREDDKHVVVHEQHREAVNRGGHEDTDREPAVLERDI